MQATQWVTNKTCSRPCLQSVCKRNNELHLTENSFFISFWCFVFVSPPVANRNSTTHLNQKLCEKRATNVPTDLKMQCFDIFLLTYTRQKCGFKTKICITQTLKIQINVENINRSWEVHQRDNQEKANPIITAMFSSALETTTNRKIINVWMTSETMTSMNWPVLQNKKKPTLNGWSSCKALTTLSGRLHFFNVSISGVHFRTIFRTNCNTNWTTAMKDAGELLALCTWDANTSTNTDPHTRTRFRTQDGAYRGLTRMNRFGTTNAQTHAQMMFYTKQKPSFILISLDK